MAIFVPLFDGSALLVYGFVMSASVGVLSQCILILANTTLLLHALRNSAHRHMSLKFALMSVHAWQNDGDMVTSGSRHVYFLAP